MSGFVAIVEDSKEDRFFMKRILRKTHPDCEVIEFTYADDALRYLRSPKRGQPDVIFVDINMPRMSGFEFVEAYEGLYDELKGETRVVMLSHSINPADERRAQENPTIHAFVQKPLTEDAVRALVS